jgi:hypothetical protein
MDGYTYCINYFLFLELKHGHNNKNFNSTKNVEGGREVRRRAVQLNCT